MDIEVIIKCHEQRAQALGRDMGTMREAQADIRTMNEALVALDNELKRINEQLVKQERRIDEIDAVLLI